MPEPMPGLAGRSIAPELSKGFQLARKVPAPQAAFLLHGGHDSWPLAEGITAISLRDMMERLIGDG